MTTSREAGLLWAFKDKANFDVLPNEKTFESYLKAILVCANGDGTLTPEERNWAVGHAAAFGAPDWLVEELKTYKADEEIEPLVSSSPETSASRRFLVYDAIRACSADGAYSDRERALVTRMAAKLGLSEELVREIEGICLEEAQLREKRLKVVYPEGPPL